MDAPVQTACADDRRADRVRAGPCNGIDYLEVEEDPRILNVYLFREAPERISRRNVRIAGGVRVRDIRVLELRIGRSGGAVGDARLQLVVDRPGDLSTYRLRLVETDALGVPTDRPMAEFDPHYSSVDFTFREGRPTEFDCKATQAAAAAMLPQPDINYLAKDYSSFRQLILDRVAVTMPAWTETHVPDIGIALVEILAYVGDYLSYYQDAVATEAYLNTARKRISVRRHLRLLDYRMHDGCNARTWICLTPDDPAARWTIDPDRVLFASVDDSVSPADLKSLSDGVPVAAVSDRIDVFEPVIASSMRVLGSHAEISFYCWGNACCSLPAGSTRATLLDGWDPPDPARRKLDLRAGDFLLFEQVRGPASGQPVDADPAQRHVVRLTRAEPGVDGLFDPPVPIVEIEWASEDALPFPLLLSAIGPAPGCALIEDISVARGNVVLADEGLRIVDEAVGQVPLQDSSGCCAGIGISVPGAPMAGDFQPVLSQPGLVSTQAVPPNAPAAGLLDQDPASALPWIRLVSIPGKPDGSGPLFTFSDLSDPSGLAVRLAAPADAATWYLRAQLSDETLTQLAASPPGAPLPDSVTAQVIAGIEGLVWHWAVKPDLLGSGPSDADFVVELDDDGFGNLRFGDGVSGRAPEAGEIFSATYRVELDAPGHMGAESITRTLVRPGPALPGVLTSRNPLAAEGQVPPQSIAEARTVGPGSPLGQLERATTADDYAALAQRNPKVQRATAVLRWTGSRTEARVAIDPLGTELLDSQLQQALWSELERCRHIGHDVTVVPARYVAIHLSIAVQIMPGHLRARVQPALMAALGSGVLPDGGRGFFHPDNLSFGQYIDENDLLAAARAIAGVQSVQIRTLKRLFEDPGQQVQNGILSIGPMEVARLDNDPARPENGRLLIRWMDEP